MEEKTLADLKPFTISITQACLNCQTPFSKAHSTTYCNLKCQVEYKRKVKNEKIRKGEIKNALAIKKYLIELDRRCSICKGVEWQGQPIPLIIDHIDGNSGDSSLQNLRLVCGNCDMQLPTYKSKNRGKGRVARKKRYYLDRDVDPTAAPTPGALGYLKKEPKCVDCGVQISQKAIRCRKCYQKDSEEVAWPEDQILLEEANKYGLLATSRKYGASSGNIVKKRLKAKGIFHLFMRNATVNNCMKVIPEEFRVKKEIVVKVTFPENKPI